MECVSAIGAFMPTPLVDLFLDAVKVDGLSLRERPMAKFIRTILDGLPITVTEDDTGRLINGDCGNIICIPEWYDAAKPGIALLAHIDTPRNTRAVRPILTSTKISSDGTSILGVDNRAGASVLLQALKETAANNGNFIIVFTVAEAIGLYGSKHINLSPYNITMGFVFDCADRPGTFVHTAAGCSDYTVTFIGKSPEGGGEAINAIKLAAKALNRVPVGSISPQLTTNVGMIVGGEGTDIVPERCVLRGEVRGFNAEEIYEHVTMLKTTFTNVVRERGGAIEFESAVDYPPYHIDPTHPLYKFTASALETLRLVPLPTEYVTGSDASILNAHGIPSVNIGIGAQCPRKKDEFILLEDLHKSLEIAQELIRLSTTL